MLWRPDKSRRRRKGKSKVTFVKALRLCTGRTAYRESRGIALLFLDYGTRRGEGAVSRPGRSLPPEKPGTHCTGGWMGPRVSLDRCGKPGPHRKSIPGPSSPYSVAIPTELPGPLYGWCTIRNGSVKVLLLYLCAKQDTLSTLNTVVLKLIVAQLVERNITSFVEPRVSRKTNQGHILEPSESSIKFALELAWSHGVGVHASIVLLFL